MRGGIVTGLLTVLVVLNAMSLLVQLSHAGGTQRILNLLLEAARRVR